MPPESNPASRQPAPGEKPATVGLVSLGCPKALVDSERIVTRLRAEGYALSGSYEGADLVIVNTCGFIDSAVQESLDAIGEALAANGKVIVTGCLGAKSERGENLVAKVHPKVLAVTGPQAMEQVIGHVHAHLPRPHDPFADLVPPAGIKLTPRHYAYLKISEGCNHGCSFCIIPSLRGRLVSRPIGEVLREAERLFQQGARELLVVSQDTGAYGVDLRYKLDFAGGRAVKTRLFELVRELGALAAAHGAWVRLHYVYPYPHVDEIVALMAQAAGAAGVLPYLDVPLQHAHPEVLRRMKRPAGGEKNIERIRAWRALCPQLTLRSTFIAGFPGETEAQFETLLDFLREAQLDRVGCFAYSPVDGAGANALDGALPDEVRAARRARLMLAQAEISRARLERKVGSVQRVLIDEVAGARSAVGRSAADAPEIDGVVRVQRPARVRRELRVGEFVDVRIVAADEHDLTGTVV
jgi:ribosomal protein S12 methylthiotransferase